jgi:ABC-type nitrate/sulfonate/bicarbonate transport system substrate-binding protein
MRRSHTLGALALAALALAACTTPTPPPATPATLRVNVFRSSTNTPLYMAQERGEFARRGLTVQLQFTPNSDEQRAGLAAGRFEIAQTAVDNAVAMVEGAKQEAVIVSGGDSGMNEFLVRREMKSAAEVKGKAYAVDAPNTAYALVGRKILRNAGLLENRDYRMTLVGGSESRSRAFENPENAAMVLAPPWNIVAKERGAKSLGRVTDLLGPYQASGIAVMRDWGRTHASELERFLAAYIAGCRATLDPANKAQVIAVLQRELRATPAMAEAIYTELNTPGHGLARDCAFDPRGFRNVLALRAEIEGQWGGQVPDMQRYVDLSYFDRARATLK